MKFELSIAFAPLGLPHCTAAPCTALLLQPIVHLQGCGILISHETVDTWKILLEGRD